MTTLSSGMPRRRPFPSTRAFLCWLVGLTLLILGLSWLTGTVVRLMPLLIFLPAFVAGVGTVRQTVAASCWVVAFVAAATTYLGGGAQDNLLALGFTAAFGALSVFGCWHRIRREEEVYRLRSATAALQRQILRPLPLRTDEVVAEGLYQPVEEDSMVGGDIYEIMPSPFGTRVLIADVQGKGLPAIGTAFAVLGAFREAAYREARLVGVVDALEHAVLRHNVYAAQSGEPERFVTAVVLSIGAGREAQVVNCGHVPPYFIGHGHTGRVRLGDPSVPLGLSALSPTARTTGAFAFPWDATLFLCTDGVTEARNSRGDFYPLEDRLRSWTDVPASRVALTLRDDLSRFTGGDPRDDLAVLTVRRAASAAS